MAGRGRMETVRIDSDLASQVTTYTLCD